MPPHPHQPVHQAVPRSLLEPEGPWRHLHVSAGGARFHVADMSGDANHDHAIILLQPFPLTWWSWRAVMPLVAQAGHRVIAMDLRGFGTSDLQAGNADLIQLALDVRSVVGALGIAQFSVVGLGMGGAVAWMVAAMHPVNLRSVVVIASPHPLSRPTLRLTRPFSRARLLELRMDIPLRRVHLLARGSVLSGIIRHWAAPAHREALLANAHPYQAALTRPFAASVATDMFSATRHLNLASRKILASDVAVPVLSAICAQDSSLTAFDFAHDSTHCAGSFTQVVFRKSGHFASEEDPDGVAHLITKFMDQVSTMSR